MYDKLTKKDIALMEAELEDRRLNQRPKIIEEVKRTREFGDLSENYEYKAAKQAQRRNDSRMRYLENMIKTAVIIDDGEESDPSQIGRIRLYDKVTLYLPEDDETMTIQICSVVRVDPDAGFISMESPLGKAVLGAKVGDVVKVKVNDSYSYEAEIQAVENAEDDGSAPLMQYRNKKDGFSAAFFCYPSVICGFSSAQSRSKRRSWRT